MKKLRVLFISLICSYSVTGYGFFQSPDSLRKLPVDSCSHANQLLARYQFPEALVYLNHCYRSDTNNIDILSKIASANYNLGRYRHAKENYRRILELDSLNVPAHNQLGTLYFKESNFSSAFHQYSKLKEIDPDNSFYLKRLAELSLKKGDLQNAVFYYENAYKLNPENIELVADLSNIYLEAKVFAKTDSLIDKGTLLDPQNFTLKQLKARSSFKQKKYEQVVNIAEDCFRHSNDSSAHLLLLLGLSYYNINDHEKAIFTLERLLVKATESEVVHCYLGLAYKATGNMDKSIFHLEQAIDLAISDNISSYYFNLAVAYEEIQRFDKSIPAYQAAYRSSNKKSLLYHLARNYDTYYKDKGTALKYYERYLSVVDSGNIDYMNYSQQRVSQLKELQHLDMDTIH